LLLRCDGTSLTRSADRQPAASPSQPPPRITRPEPSFGPLGSLTAPLGFQGNLDNQKISSTVDISLKTKSSSAIMRTHQFFVSRQGAFERSHLTPTSEARETAEPSGLTMETRSPQPAERHRKPERTGLRKPVYVTQQRTASYPTNAWAEYHSIRDYGWRLAWTSADVLALRMGAIETFPLSKRRSLATGAVCVRDHRLLLALVAPTTRILSSSGI